MMGSEFGINHVLKITSIDRREVLGTGFIIWRDPGGVWLATCAHVVDNAGGANKTLADGLPVDLVAKSSEEDFDLAILKVDSSAKQRTLMKQGMKVDRRSGFITAGFYHEGRSLCRARLGEVDKETHYSTASGDDYCQGWILAMENDDALRPGYSGAPVFHTGSSRCFGMFTHLLGDGDKGMAISVAAIGKVWKEKPSRIFETSNYSRAEELAPRRLVFDMKSIFDPKSMQKVDAGHSVGRDEMSMGARFADQVDYRGPQGWALLCIRIESEKVESISEQDVKKLESFKDFTFHCIKEFGGDLITWSSEEGGIFVFWGDRRCEDCAAAGIHILDVIARNSRNSDEILGNKFHIKATANDEMIFIDSREARLEMPVAELQEIFLNSKSAYADSRSEDLPAGLLDRALVHTMPGEFRITEHFFNKINPQDGHFAYAEVFEDIVFFSYSSARLATLTYEFETLVYDIDDIGERLAVAVEHFRESRKEAEEDKLRLLAGDLYSNIGGILYKSRQTIDGNPKHWSGGLDISRIIGYLDRVLASEERASHCALAALTESVNVPGRSSITLKFMLNRRAQVVFTMMQLRERLQRSLEGRDGIKIRAILRKSISEEQERVKRLVGEFLEAREWESYELFMKMFNDRRNRNLLYEYLMGLENEKKDPRTENVKRRMVKRLWRKADVILLEEINLDPDTGFTLVRALSDGPYSLGVFRAAWRAVLIGESVSRLHGKISDLLSEEVVSGVTERDKEIVTRCVVAANSCSAARKQAIESVDLSSLWEIVMHRNAPINNLYDIGMSLSSGEDAVVEARQRIFFDLVEARVRSAVQEALTFEELNDITKMFGLFRNFKFLIDDTRYSRYDDIYHEADSTITASKHLTEDQVEELRDVLRGWVFRAPEDLPNGIADELSKAPLVVWKHLAQNGKYIDLMVCHPNSGIAKEVINFIKPSDIPRILRYRSINKDLFNHLINTNMFLASNSNIDLALAHRWCSIRYAEKKFRKKPFSMLKRYAADHNLRRDIQNAAILEALQKPGCTVTFAKEYMSRLSMPKIQRISKNRQVKRQIRDIAKAKLLQK